MQFTKEEILKNVEQAFYQCCEKNNSQEVSVSQVLKYAGLRYEDKDTVLSICGVRNYPLLIMKIEKFDVYTPDNSSTNMVRIKKEYTDKHQRSSATAGLYERIRTLLQFLNQGLYEKEKVTRLVLLSALAGESVFLLGPPGTAKSMIARRLSALFKDAQDRPLKYFEYLLNEFTTPDELFGPVSLEDLNHDKYSRKTEGFLPSADSAFLDEIWKAGPAILNTLLTIINEKKFHNGNTVEPVPLKVVIAASNELPAQHKGLEALWDRFIMRIPVMPIPLDKPDAFFQMIKQAPDSEELFGATNPVNVPLLSFAELHEWQAAIAQITLPETVQQVVIDIRQRLAEYNAQKKRPESEKYYISDRRWKHIFHLIRTAAYIHGRKEVSLMDAALIAECIWSTEAQRHEVQKIVGKALAERGISGTAVLAAIEERITQFRNEINTDFYESVTKSASPAAPRIAEHEGKQFYQAANQAGTPFYFEVPEPGHTFVMQYNEHWALPKKIMIDSFSADKKTLTASGEVFTLVWKNAESAETVFEKKTTSFEDAALYEKFTKELDEKHYLPISSDIVKGVESLKQYRQQIVNEFSTHLFADHHYAAIIAGAIDKNIAAIEDAKIVLDKERERYEKRD